MAGHQVVQSLAEVRSNSSSVVDHIVVEDVFGRGVSSSAGQRIATERGTVISGLEGHRFVRSHERADWHAAAEAFGEGHDIGFNAE